MTTPTIYDAIPYPGKPFPQTHPDLLGTLATLYGLASPNVSTCRVLEIGCGDGFNLIPIALSLPSASCLGIDLVATGITKGNAVIQQLGLKNITLRQLDMLEINPDFGQFDYIIAHGIYSWIPENVRNKLLSICKENLAQNGVAYISYNAYPGGHLRNMVRDMMRYHSEKHDSLEQKLLQARALLEFIAGPETDAHLNGSYQAVLQSERNRIRAYTDNSLYHDDLLDCNAPVYFSEFMAHAGQYGLQYLTEAVFAESQTDLYPPEVIDVLNQISNSIIEKEQYMDFIRGRRFRQTLLCHEAQELDHTPHAENIVDLYIGSFLRPEFPDCDPNAQGSLSFIRHNNVEGAFSIDNPLFKSAFIQLGRAWPNTIQFSKLLDEVVIACNVKQDTQENIKILTEMLLAAYAGGLVEFYSLPSRFVVQSGEYPIASPLARLQSAESTSLTNLKHSSIKIEDPIDRLLLQLLDGSRDKAILIHEISEWIVSGKVSIPQYDVKFANADQIRDIAAEQLELSLNKLGSSALLLA